MTADPLPMGPKSRQAPSADIQLELLRQLTSRLLTADGIDAVLRAIAECTTTALGYEDCVVYLRTVDDFLMQRAAYGPKSPNGTDIVDPIRLRLGVGIVGSAALEGQAILVHDTRLDARYVVDDADRRSELAVPIVDDGHVLAVIDSEHSEPNFYTDADRKVITDIAAIAAVRLRTAMATEQLNRSISDLQTTRAELENLSSTDDLTGLGNRRKFEHDLGIASASGEPFSVCILDLDKFKRVNDMHGHHEGDAVLRQLGDILSGQTADPAVTLARLGGDEFAILQQHGDLAGFDHVIDSIRRAVRDTPWSANAALLDLSVSAGVATGCGVHVWAQADEALLLAKAEGGDQMVRFVPSDPRAIAMREDRLWARSIRDAISTDRFTLVGQPIFDASKPDEPAHLIEVLLRYTADDGSMLAPGVFLDSAERFGLIGQIDTWVIRNAVAWLAGTRKNLDLAVNVSAESLLNGLAVREAVSEMRAHNLAPSRLTLEVPESAALADPMAFRAAVADARQAGVRVALDDFGNGWNALALLQEEPVDVIKIDGSWVSRATTDAVARTLVRAMVECGRILGTDVTAEWVEDAQTMELMRSMGVTHLQGFHLGEPRPLGPVINQSASHRVA